MAKENKTLHLVLKRKWWDMIESGDKKEEYRTQSDYWIKGFVDGEYYGSDGLDMYKPFENVCFHLGYTNTTMTFRIAHIYIMDMVFHEWGRRQGESIYNFTWRKD